MKTFLLALVLGASSVSLSQLNGLSFCIDPGHGGHNPANDRRIEPDPGIVFWESEGNFRKALLLDTLLRSKGATVILTRYTNDYPNDDEPTLAARVAIANANNVNWFHSIHSNAFNGVTNYTLLLVRESTTTPGQPESPPAFAMSALMSPRIQSKLRTTANYTRLDFSFLGFRLGVLNGLNMPGELSEGSFHDVFPETRRLMNNHYRKMEAYALRDAILQYFGAPADPLGIIAGLQTQIGVGSPINWTQVRLLPLNRVYYGDGYNNGFFMFDELAAGSYTVRYETPGFALDSVTTSLPTGATVFADRQLESFLAPTIATSIPVNGDTLFSADRSITLQFSKPMNTSSVVSAFSLFPSYTGLFTWSNNNSRLVFNPDSILPFFVNFTLKVDSSARSAGGQFLDGDGNGVPGDSYFLYFRTRDVDAFPPQITASYPGAGDTVRSPTQVLSITFDEKLNPATVTLTNVSVQKIGGSVLPREVQYWESGIRGGINVYLSSPVEPGSSYRVRVSGVTDVVGNIIPNTSPIIWQFLVEPGVFQYTTVDLFDTALVYWRQPMASGNTTGVDSARFSLNFVTVVPPATTNPSAAQLVFDWNTGASTWFLHEELLGGPPQAVVWRKENTVLRVHVHGDASQTLFRLSVADSNGYEVNMWQSVDWVGWRMVEWDFEHDPLGAGTGDGVLNGDLRFDSFQLTYLPGTAASSGRLIFDNLQLATSGPVSVEDVPPLPGTFALSQNYPNPFNPSTTLSFSLPEAGHVTLVVYDLLGRQVAMLADGLYEPGTHAIEWNAADRASGMYLARMTVTRPDGSLRFQASTKLALVR